MQLFAHRWLQTLPASGTHTETTMGLLDNLMGDSLDDPKTTGLLALAANLSSGPKFMPALAQGLLARQGLLADAETQRQKKGLLGLQMQERQLALQQQQRQADQQQRAQDFLQNLPSPQMQAAQTALAGGGGPTQANALRMPQVDPAQQQLLEAVRAGVMPYDQYLSSMRKDDTPVKLGPGEVLLGGRASGYKPLATAPQKEDDFVTNMRTAGIDPASPQGRALMGQWLQKQSTHQAPVNVNLAYETEYAKAQGKDFADMMSGLNKTSFTAPAQLRKLERMDKLLADVDGGKLAPMGLEVASALNSLGIKVDPRLGNKEAAESLAREMAGGLRQPGTGPMTDKDFENFMAQVPSLSKSASGRRQIIETMRASLNRDMELAKRARDYQRRTGKLDNGFLDEMSQFIAENPVVAAPAGWKVVR